MWVGAVKSAPLHLFAINNLPHGEPRRTMHNVNAKRLPWLDGHESVDELLSEGRKSLTVFLDMCRENGVAPFREFSGRFNVRLAAEVHEAAVLAAAAENKSLNEWVAEAIEAAARAA